MKSSGTKQPCTAASTKAKVTVDCSVPTCSITKPVITPAHPKLNGVPAAQGGDRASAIGSPYQAAFEVTTNIADNRDVTIEVNDSTTPGTIIPFTAKVAAGKATFAGIPLPPGPTYQIQARCVDGNGVVGLSTKGSYIVVRHGLHFNQTRQTGSVLHMLTTLSERGRIGLTAVGESQGEADEFYQRAVDVLDREAAGAMRQDPLPAP